MSLTARNIEFIHLSETPHIFGETWSFPVVVIMIDWF